MKELETMHVGRLRPGFDGHEEKLDAEIDIQTSEITRMFHSTGDKIKQISSPPAPNTSDRAVQLNLQR